MQFRGGGAVSLMCFLGSFVTPQVNVFPIRRDTGFEPLGGILRDSLESVSLGFTTSIAGVLKSRRFSKVFPAIVVTNAIAVV